MQQVFSYILGIFPDTILKYQLQINELTAIFAYLFQIGKCIAFRLYS